MAAASPAQILVALLPLLITAISLLIIAVPISLRKGRNPILWGLLCCIPFINIFLVIWLTSKTDIEVKNQIKSLQDDLVKIKSSLDNKIDKP
jgi:hypothetical protein